MTSALHIGAPANDDPDDDARLVALADELAERLYGDPRAVAIAAIRDVAQSSDAPARDRIEAARMLLRIDAADAERARLEARVAELEAALEVHVGTLPAP